MRLGRIGYINCYPVYGAIDRNVVAAPGELVTGTPAELNDLLVAGELDVSVISAGTSCCCPSWRSPATGRCAA